MMDFAWVETNFSLPKQTIDGITSFFGSSAEDQDLEVLCLRQWHLSVKKMIVLHLCLKIETEACA